MTGLIALRDGAFAFDPGLLPALRADPDAASRLLGRPLSEPVEVPVMAYALRTDGGWTLFDAGGGALMGPGFGGLRGAMAARGIAPAAVTAICLTHLHGDHCGGLLDGEGAAFPNARVALARAERDFWLDPRLPASLAPIAADAARALAPYAGRIDEVEPGDRVGPAEALAAPGHTPGHTAWRVPGALVGGDILHLPLQRDRPDWSSGWDLDPAAAAGSRRALVARALAEDLDLACGHLAPGSARHPLDAGREVDPPS